MDRIATIEWDGEEYRLEYTFGIIRRLKSDGLNVTRIFRIINADPDCAADYADDIACIVSFLLQEAGCKTASPETVFERCMRDEGFKKVMFQLFIWVAVCHLTQSDNLPGPQSKKKTAPIAKTGKKKRKKR